MSDTAPTLATPARRINWLVVALVASLAVNLLIAGAAAARWYVSAGPERYTRLTQSQLIPRNFFHDLDRSRRMELLGFLKAQDRQVRDGRRAVKAQVIALADALAAEPYDPERVKSAVEGFTARSEALFVTGSKAAMAVIEQLTSEERKLMAMHLRNREDRGRGGRPDGDGKPDAP